MTKRHFTVAKKTTRGQSRIWIEGNRLSAAGFHPGTRYHIAYHPSEPRVVMAVDEKEGTRSVTNSTRNGKARPIIDLHCAELTEVFKPNTQVEVIYQNEIIEIVPIIS